MIPTKDSKCKLNIKGIIVVIFNKTGANITEYIIIQVQVENIIEQEGQEAKSKIKIIIIN